MRGRAAVMSAAAALSVLAVTGFAGVASADITLPVPPLPPVPSVPVPPVVPPTAPPPPSLPAPTPAGPSAGGGGGGGGGAAGGGGGSASSGTSGPTAGTPDTSSPAGTSRNATTGPKRKRAKGPVNPIIAGRPRASDVVDDEATPALHRATKDFLKADRQIAALAKLRDQIAAAKAGAAGAATKYKALQPEIDNLRQQAETRQQRSDLLRRTIVADARKSYQTGHLTISDQGTRDLAAAAAGAKDAAARTQRQLDAAVSQQNLARAEFDTFAAQYRQAKDRLTSINNRLEALAEQRAAALTAARQATAGDQAQHRQTLAESGAFGAQVRTAAARLAATGQTVLGTGHFAQPSSGGVTSPYGQRFHPILHYVKLHTGTDFGAGDGFAHAADDGRVLFTVLSAAYGNFTVIDHGVIDGRHITTAYAHQAKFLVRPGQAVTKGETIGVIGATGYATGPHLHFEVRDNGAVEDPMPWLAR